jgi:hypothetical protein
MKFSSAIVCAAIAIFSLSVEALPTRRGDGFVTQACRADSDCQQGCCAFNTGKCAGPGIAQTRDGGCGFGNPTPNCNVAAALQLSDCVAGAQNGDLSSPDIQAAAAFVSKLDNIPLPPPPAAAVSHPRRKASEQIDEDQKKKKTVFEPCKRDSECQQGCCARNTGKCAGPGIAQTRDGGCGRGDTAPNCNVAKLLKLGVCAKGAKKGDLKNPDILAAARFTSKLDNIPFSG